MTADASGNISDQFNLPDWFVATYTVTATGAQSGVATTSFTDGNVTFDIAPSNNTAQFVETLDSASSNFTWATKSGFPKTLNNPYTVHNVRVSAAMSRFEPTLLQPLTGALFSAWSTRTAPVHRHRGNQWPVDCVSGDPSGTQNIPGYAHFVGEPAPVAQPQPLVSTNEDTAKTITLTGTDADGNNLTFAIVTGPSQWDPRLDRSGHMHGDGAQDLLGECHLHAQRQLQRR